MILAHCIGKMKWQLDACCRSRIGFSDALLSDNLGRAKRPRQAQLGRVRRAAPRAASRAVAHPVSRVIECACARDASAIPALLVAVLRVRLSWSATEAVSRCWQRAAKSAAPETPNVRFATQDLQPSTGEEAACSRQRRKLERIASAMAVYGIRLRKIVRADGRQVEGRGYALWRADSSAICGRVAGVC